MTRLIFALKMFQLLQTFVVAVVVDVVGIAVDVVVVTFDRNKYESASFGRFIGRTNLI